MSKIELVNSGYVKSTPEVLFVSRCFTEIYKHSKTETILAQT